MTQHFPNGTNWSDSMTVQFVFKIPGLIKLTTKTLQLEAPYTVRSKASKSFKSIIEQKDLMSKLLRTLQQNMGLNMLLNSNWHLSQHA